LLANIDPWQGGTSKRLEQPKPTENQAWKAQRAKQKKTALRLLEETLEGLTQQEQLTFLGGRND